jgi:hypothetical protein
MKIKKFNELQTLNEGMRVNPKLLSLDGEYNIEDVIKEIKILSTEIIEWKKNGAKKVKGKGSEWYPLWD